MKTVLLVDDDKPLLEKIGDGAREYSDHFELLTAENGKEAVKTLNRIPIHLVITELKLPIIDGFELLAYMSTHFPMIPVFILTGLDSRIIEEKLDKSNFLRILKKPLEFDVLLGHIEDGLKLDDQGGSFFGLTVGNFLQLVEWEQKTCLMEIQNKENRKGLFFFDQGVIYDAICGELRADEAAIEMIGWEDVKIDFKFVPDKKIRRQIHTGLMSLIMESMRLKDEMADREPARDSAGKSEISENDQGGDFEGSGDFQMNDNEKNKEDLVDKREGRTLMASLKEMLAEMGGEIDGLIATGVVGFDGIGIAYHNPTHANLEAYDAKFSMVLKLLEKAITEIQGENLLEELLVQTKTSWVLLRILNKEYFLGIATSRDATLGNVRFVANKYVGKLLEIIE